MEQKYMVTIQQDEVANNIYYVSISFTSFLMIGPKEILTITGS
jgi:hypothetical protein